MNANLAVLIDGDNIPSASIKEMMEEIAKYGNPTIKRIYGDWTKPNLAKLTLARQIAAVTLSMWKKGVPFDPAKLTKPS